MILNKIKACDKKGRLKINMFKSHSIVSMSYNAFSIMLSLIRSSHCGSMKRC